MTHLLLLKTVSNFPERYISISANNEHNFLNKLWHKISNMLPKLHKSKKINKIIEIKRTEYIQTDEDILMKHPKFYNYIMKPSLSLIPQIVKVSFDFTQKLEK